MYYISSELEYPSYRLPPPAHQSGAPTILPSIRIHNHQPFMSSAYATILHMPGELDFSALSEAHALNQTLIIVYIYKVYHQECVVHRSSDTV